MSEMPSWLPVRTCSRVVLGSRVQRPWRWHAPRNAPCAGRARARGGLGSHGSTLAIGGPPITMATTMGPGSYSSTTTTRSSTTWSKSSESSAPSRPSSATTPSTWTASGRPHPTPSSSRRARAPRVGRREHGGGPDICRGDPDSSACASATSASARSTAAGRSPAPTLMHGKDLADPPRRHRRLRRATRSVRRDPLPLPGHRTRVGARRARGHREDERRRRDGTAAPGAGG